MSLKQRARELLNRGIDYMQGKFPPNRVVLLLTPLAVPLAAAASAWLAANVPGVPLSEGTIIGFAAAAGLTVIRNAYKWVDRWQEEERTNDRSFELGREAELEQARRARAEAQAGLENAKARARSSTPLRPTGEV